ncbi:MAG: DUF2973 domain-containing protein [Cyanobacteria bacterium J06621_11]
MLHLLYVLAFTILAVLAVSNMIRNIVQLGTQVQRPPQRFNREEKAERPVPHPELLNERGDVINEPLLVMRSISIKDAREQLNALYESSSETEDSASEEG